MIISKNWIFKLPDIDQGIQKHVIQKKRSLEHFWKMLSKEMEKNSILVYPGLRYTNKKLNFACKFFFFQKMFAWVRKSFCGWKKNTKKFLGAISKIYGNCIVSIFFWQKIFLFYLVRYTKIYAKTREKLFENSMTPF